MAKEIIMPLTEYNEEMTKAQVSGMNLIVNAVRDILSTGGANTKLSDGADPGLVKFVNEMKEVKTQLGDYVVTSSVETNN
jgi:hypothetical protein